MSLARRAACRYRGTHLLCAAERRGPGHGTISSIARAEVVVGGQPPGLSASVVLPSV